MREDLLLYDYQGIKHHPKMTIEKRAAQFNAYDALCGYKEELAEVRRETQEKRELMEDKKEELDRKMNELMYYSEEVEVTYYEEDLTKKGGEYKVVKGRIHCIDFKRKEIYVQNQMIPVKDIYNIKTCENSHV